MKFHLHHQSIALKLLFSSCIQLVDISSGSTYGLLKPSIQSMWNHTHNTIKWLKSFFLHKVKQRNQNNVRYARSQMAPLLPGLVKFVKLWGCPMHHIWPEILLVISLKFWNLFDVPSACSHFLSKRVHYLLNINDKRKSEHMICL